MALNKVKILNNGSIATYWVAQPMINMISKKTDVLMLGFKDKVTRDAGKQFMVRERVPSIDGIYLSGEQVYAGIKASRMVEVSPAVEAVDAVLDEDGNVLKEAVEAQDAVIEEQNWFADATDILEE